MKQKKSVSNFLKVNAQLLSLKQPPKVQAHCEVVGIGPISKKETASQLLPSEFKNYTSVLDQLLKQKELSSKACSSVLVRFSGGLGGKHVLFFSLGNDRSGIDALGAHERLRRLGASIIHTLEAEKLKSAVILFDSFLVSKARLQTKPTEAACALVEGLGLASYHFSQYQTKKQESEPYEITLMSTRLSQVNAYQRGIENASVVVEATNLCRDLSNSPSNELYPQALANRAKLLASQYGISCSVLDVPTLKKEKMGLLLGVGQGSQHPPCMVCLEYKPAGKKKALTIALVGKGVTFDSGGISIKPATKMEDMKHDMSGSAAVLGAILAAARLKLKCHILAVLAVAENMPSGKAIQPGNILYSRAGKTVEIINTDAEGRLVLADALDWVQDKNPDYIIDLATLTGAATITLGKSCAGLMGNDPALVQKIKEAASRSGEKVWELPLYEEYFDDLKSHCADMRNSGDSPSHGTAKGAMFLKQFIRPNVKWAHLDIASMAYAGSLFPYNPKKGSSGYGVRLLVELLKGF